MFQDSSNTNHGSCPTRARFLPGYRTKSSQAIAGAWICWTGDSTDLQNMVDCQEWNEQMWERCSNTATDIVAISNAWGRGGGKLIICESHF